MFTLISNILYKTRGTGVPVTNGTLIVRALPDSSVIDQLFVFGETQNPDFAANFAIVVVIRVGQVNFAAFAAGKLHHVPPVRRGQGQYVGVEVEKVVFQIEHQHEFAETEGFHVVAGGSDEQLFSLLAVKHLFKAQHLYFVQLQDVPVKSHVFSGQFSVFQDTKRFDANYQQVSVVKRVRIGPIFGCVVENVKFIVVAM